MNMKCLFLAGYCCHVENRLGQHGTSWCVREKTLRRTRAGQETFEETGRLLTIITLEQSECWVRYGQPMLELLLWMKWEMCGRSDLCLWHTAK